MADRDCLKTTFDSAARLYQQARPDYPDALYHELVRVAALRPGDRLLEIGCATGKATAPLARHDFRITCVEIGTELATEGRRNLAVFPCVEVVEAAFETWRPSRTDAFALVSAATAWHWIDPAVKYRHAWELLRPGGHLAFWTATHVFPPGRDTFFRDIQDVYDQIGEGVPPVPRGRDRGSCRMIRPRSKTAVCSCPWPCASSIGKSATAPRSTCGC